MGKRSKRSTWRLTDANYDWLYQYAKRLGKVSGIGDVSLNAALNVCLERLREYESQADASATAALRVIR